MPSSVPKLMPRAVPAKAVIAAHEGAFRRQERDIGSNRRGLVELIRKTALHEAAHAVAHWQFGDEIVFASLMPTDDLMGRVRIRTSPYRRRHVDDHIRATLAGCAAEAVSVADYLLDEQEGYIPNAVETLGLEQAAIRIPELWEETVVYVTHPRVWRAMVSVADALLRKGQLEGHEIGLLFTKAAMQPVAGLNEARMRILQLGADLHWDALESAIDAASGTAILS